MKSFVLVLLLTLALPLCAQTQKQSLYVQGRFLYTPCGDKVILRGVNKMHIYDANNFGIGVLPEIRKTGANVVRIVWTTDKDNAIASATNLDRVIEACITNDMIPLVELHDATGDWSKLQQCMDYWLRADVLAVVKKHQKYIIVNIANEAGDFEVSDNDFRNTYRQHVQAMRTAGIVAPILIDATGYGQNIDILLNNSQYLIDNDPEHNLMFSLHAYWQPQYFDNPLQLMKQKLEAAVNNNIPLIIGEFTGCYTDDPNSNDQMYTVLLPECEQLELGWIAWEWGPGNADYSVDPPLPYPLMDLTSDGTFASIKDNWSKTILLSDPNSIQKTSVTPQYIIDGGICAINTSVTEHSSGSFYSGPNPAHEFFVVETGGLNTELTVVDIMGRVVLQKITTGSPVTVGCSSWSAGMYTIICRSDGAVLWTQHCFIVH